MSRRRDQGSLERAFRASTQHVERAKDVLVAAMPSARYPGAPLAEALHAFESALADARAAMAGWRAGETEDAWTMCMNGLDEAAGMAERLRLRAPQLDFEGLAMVLGDLIAPLDAFDDAETVVRRADKRS